MTSPRFALSRVSFVALGALAAGCVARSFHKPASDVRATQSSEAGLVRLDSQPLQQTREPDRTDAFIPASPEVVASLAAKADAKFSRADV